MGEFPKSVAPLCGGAPAVSRTVLTTTLILREYHPTIFENYVAEIR